MPAPSVVIEITSRGSDRVRREIEGLRRFAQQQTTAIRAATTAQQQQARAAELTARQVISAQRATEKFAAASQRVAGTWSLTTREVLSAQRGVRGVVDAQNKATLAAKATADNWGLTSRQILAAQRAASSFAAQQAAAARIAFTGGIGTVGAGRAATAAELRGARAGVGRMEASQVAIETRAQREAARAQAATAREAARASQDLEKARRSSARTAREEARAVSAGQRAWDAFAISTGRSNDQEAIRQRVLAQTRRAKDQLRAAVNAGAITQEKANQSLRRAIIHYRDLAKNTRTWRDEVQVAAQLFSGQAVASAVPGIGGFALGSALGARGIGVAAGVVGAVGVGAGALQLATAGNELRLLQAQLRAFTPDAASANQAFASLVATSRETGTSLQSNAVLMRRLTQAQKDLGASTSDLSQFQGIVTKLMIASGVATTEAAAGTLQLSQALASGKVQGDEFRSVMENMTAVARVAAQGLYEMGLLTKPTIGELNRLREAGALTAKDFFQAVLSQGEQANALFAKMPDTIGRAASGVANEFFLLTGRLGETSGATDLLIGYLRTLEGLLRKIKEVSDIRLPFLAPGDALTSAIEGRLGLTAARQQREALSRTGAGADEIGGLLRPVPIIGPPELLRRPRFSERNLTREQLQSPEAAEQKYAQRVILDEQLRLTRDVVAAQFEGVDAAREAEHALRAQVMAREKGVSVQSDEIQGAMQLWRIEDAIGAAAATRAEGATQQQLAAEIAAGGQQTEQLRIQTRLIAAKEQHGETYLAMMADEIVATEQLRTQLEAVVTTLDLTRQLEDLKLATQYAGQETEEYRKQAQELEVKRRQAGMITAEQKDLVAAIQAEASARDSASATVALREQLKDIQLARNFAGEETEEYRVQVQLLEHKRKLLADATAEQEALIRAIERERSMLQRQREFRGITQGMQQQQLSMRFAGDNAMWDALGMGTSQEFRVQQELLRIRQDPSLGPAAADAFEPLIRQSEELNTQLTIMENVVPNLADGFAGLAETAIFEDLSSAGEELYRTIVRITLQVTLLKAAMGLASAFGPGAAGGFGAGDTTGAGGAGFSYTFAGGPRQHGGRVSRGGAYPVGEAGPEMFVPDTAGNIISNSELSRRFRAPASMAAPHINVGGVQVIDQRRQGSPDIETSVDPSGFARVLVRGEIGNMARDGTLSRLTGTRRQGIARG